MSSWQVSISRVGVAERESALYRMRVFDVCASGGFQIVDYKEEIEEYYELGREIETFSSIEELKDMICFYLNNRQEATEIGLRARVKTLKHHTYEHRVQSILADVLSLDNFT